jgi:hypothetical protein
MKPMSSPTDLEKRQQDMDRATLRRLVDIVWNEATESTTVPSTDWADRLIDRALTAAPSPPRGEETHTST